uniref:G_PROTEIN_RECEP_F1_2 domain-containing protein n=1 Tax=Heterorhabditis bacteriophora TaxID=37862 RepID=A0A1I7XJI0_HETBA
MKFGPLKIQNRNMASAENQPNQEQVPMTMIYLTLALSLIGLAGNAFIILATVVTRNLQNRCNILICILAIADLAVCIYLITHRVIAFFSRYSKLPKVLYVCLILLVLIYAGLVTLNGYVDSSDTIIPICLPPTAYNPSSRKIWIAGSLSIAILVIIVYGAAHIKCHRLNKQSLNEQSIEKIKHLLNSLSLIMGIYFTTWFLTVVALFVTEEVAGSLEEQFLESGIFDANVSSKYVAVLSTFASANSRTHNRTYKLLLKCYDFWKDKLRSVIEDIPKEHNILFTDLPHKLAGCFFINGDYYKALFCLRDAIRLDPTDIVSRTLAIKWAVYLGGCHTIEHLPPKFRIRKHLFSQIPSIKRQSRKNKVKRIAPVHCVCTIQIHLGFL